MSLIIALLAAVCTSLSSFLFRKSGDYRPESSRPTGYLLLFYLSSFVLAFVLFPDCLKFHVNWIMLGIGACVGCFSSALMFLTYRALKTGPAGLTYAFQSASAIFPGLILFIILGEEYGFSTTYLQWIGMLLVLQGLFLGARKESEGKGSLEWLIYAIGCFVVQVLALTFIHGRSVLFDCCAQFFSNISFTAEDDIWFMPGQFGAAALVQSIFFMSEGKKLERKESLLGSLGGAANFFSTFLLLVATKIALPLENAILFPCFAVSGMVLSNIWANRIYKESFNLKTNLLCSAGIVIACI